jgi:broad specificity phosphatase PhoE
VIDFRGVMGRGSFYFLRHGESEGNSAGVLQGRGDYPLAEGGHGQARQAARWFRRRSIDRILSSPLARARSTAEIVAAELGGLPVEVREDLTELDIGIFTGLTMAEARARHPREWERFQRESWEGVPGAERIDALLERAGRLWSFLAEALRSGDSNVLSVTHSGILQWIIKATLGQRQWMPIFPIGNCGVSLFQIDNRRQADPPEPQPPGAPAERGAGGGVPTEGREAAEAAAYYWEWSMINHSTLH